MIRKSSWGARGAAIGVSLALVGGAALVAAAPAQADEAVQVTAADIRPDESTYPGWHQGYDDAADRYSVTADGLKLTGESQVLYGYTDSERLSGATLESLVNAGDVAWSTTAGAAYFQLPLYYGDPSDPKFTTLRPAAPVDGTNTADLGDQWATSTAITAADGSTLYAKDATATLGQFLTDLDLSSVQVLGFGVLTEAGTSSVVTGITFNGSSYTFVQPPVSTDGATATVSGSATVGSTLTVTSTGWPNGTQLSYEWFASGGNYGGPIDGATSTTYTVTDDVVGQSVGVIVTGTLDGYSSSWIRSNVVGPVTAPKKPAAAAPAASSTDLPAYFQANGVTPQAPAAAGLPATLDPTQDYTASVGWASADSYVDVYLYSTPILLGTFPVVNGKVQVTLSADVLSKLAAGTHTLVVVGQSSGAAQAVTLSLAATSTASLADTGSDTAIPATIAGLLLLLGAACLVVARRRRIAQA